MITVVQLRVLRKMLSTNVLTLTHGGVFFRGGEVGKRNVRRRTIEALGRKGLVEAIEGSNWLGAEYQITEAGREVVGESVPSSVRKELEHAITIMDEEGRTDAGGNSLGFRDWDTVRQCLLDALELLEEGSAGDFEHGICELFKEYVPCGTQGLESDTA